MSKAQMELLEQLADADAALYWAPMERAIACGPFLMTEYVDSNGAFHTRMVSPTECRECSCKLSGNGIGGLCFDCAGK